MAYIKFAILQMSPTYLRLIPLLLPLAHISLTGSIYFTLSISLERYNTVCRPFQTVKCVHFKYMGLGVNNLYKPEALKFN